MNLHAKATAGPAFSFWLCAGLSVALHAAVLGLPRSPPPRVADGVASATLLRGRLLAPDPSWAAEAAKAPPSDTSTARATGPGAERPPVARPAKPAAPVTAVAAPAAPAPAAAGDDADAYLPRSLLSVSPVLVTPVTIPEPSGLEADRLGARVGVLAIYIDEAGRVREVLPQEPRLPPELEDIVRQTFMAARYTPGERDGRAVRSRIRVEVVFQGRAIEAP